MRFSDTDRRLASASPAAFAHVVTQGQWVPYAHLLLLDAALLRVANGQTRRLIVTVPPRHGKSELTSKYFPAWYLGRFPDRQVMLASYEAGFAATWGGKARNLLEEHGPSLFGVRVSDRTSAKDRWEIDQNTGIMVTAGVGGALTGMGAHCLPGETLVSTDAGPVRIDTLAHMQERPKAMVLSRGEVRYQPIIAAQETATDELYVITTNTGHRVRATGRHRFFVPGRGYVEAQDLHRGDHLTVTDQPSVRSVRQPNAAITSLPTVLHEAAQRRRDGDMRSMRSPGREEGVRDAKGPDEGPYGRVLLSRVQPRGPRDQEPPALHSVREPLREEDPQVLFGRVPSRVAAGADPEVLQGMRRRVPGGLNTPDVLLKRLREQGALGEHAGRWQLALPGRHELRGVVPGDAPVDPRAGWRPVLALSYGGRDGDGAPTRPGPPAGPVDVGDPPHRRGPTEQQGSEPRDAVRPVPHDSPQVADATIVAIERVRTDGLPVYDLQVAEQSHFFADGVLVHNCLIIDDPVKNAEDAQSATMREKAWDWWRSTARTRLMPKSDTSPEGAVVVVQTRWHEDDLAGRMIEHSSVDGDEWEVVNLPALAEADDPMGREPGDALCPELFDETSLNETLKVLGSYWFAALYQQTPSPAEGLLFKDEHFRYWTMSENADGQPFIRLHSLEGTSKSFDIGLCTKFQTCDVAASEKKTADYTVVTTFLRTPDMDLIVWDQAARKFDLLEVPDFIEGVWVGQGRPPLHIERFGHGYGVVKTLRNRGIPVHDLDPVSDKVTRAMDAVARYEAHTVYHPKSAPWLDDLEAELKAFPNGAHDDRVDTIAYGAIKLPTVAGVSGSPVIRTRRAKARRPTAGRR